MVEMTKIKTIIKPCPFCGHEGKVFYGGFGEIFVACSNDPNKCGCQLGSGIWFTNEEDAINFWNQRAYNEKNSMPKTEEETCHYCQGTGQRPFGHLAGDYSCPMCKGLGVLPKLDWQCSCGRHNSGYYCACGARLYLK